METELPDAFGKSFKALLAAEVKKSGTASKVVPAKDDKNDEESDEEDEDDDEPPAKKPKTKAKAKKPCAMKGVKGKKK